VTTAADDDGKAGSSWDAYRTARERVEALQAQISMAREAARAALAAFLRERWGLQAGETIVVSAGKRYVFAGPADDRWLSSGVHRPDEKPWIAAVAIRKDGTRAKQAVTLHRDWDREEA
jgi:hypothetical protein